MALRGIFVTNFPKNWVEKWWHSLCDGETSLEFKFCCHRNVYFCFIVQPHASYDVTRLFMNSFEAWFGWFIAARCFAIPTARRHSIGIVSAKIDREISWENHWNRIVDCSWIWIEIGADIELVQSMTWFFIEKKIILATNLAWVLLEVVFERSSTKCCFS